MHSLSICAQLGTLILQRRGKKLDARVKRFYSFTPFSLSSLPPWETLQLHLHRGNDDSAIFNLAGAIISSFSSLPPPTLSLSLSVFLPFYHNPARFYLYFGDNNGSRGARNVKEINHGMPGNIYAVSKEEHRALLGFGLSIF